MKKFTTRSEEIFFAVCRARGWVATKIDAPGNKRAPDFIVRAGGITFVAEIKEFHPSKNPKSTNRHRPAQKLRKAINNARGQLKDHDCPTILVILDMTGNDYVNVENIRTEFLSKEKNRHNQNTEISAVGALLESNQNWTIEIYCNPSADFLFPRSFLANE